MVDEMNTFHATCLCKSSTLSFIVPAFSLPLPTHFCHCSICRRTHGTIAVVHTPIPDPVVDLSTFTAYRSSGKVERYFCSTCGAHMLDKADEGYGVQWNVATSLVDAGEENWDFHAHLCLGGTGDGGSANWMAEVGGRRLKMWGEKPVDDGKGREDRLQVKCHCGGIEFYISRPIEDNWKDLPPSLTPRDKTKWYASSDFCNSCRLCSSLFFTSWAFPATSAITLSDGSPYRPVFGTAKAYESSKGVLRTFCGTCGALVSYSCDDRSGMVDIGVGLLRGNGVLCEEWLEWRTSKIAYAKDVIWKEISTDLQNGLRKWGEAKHQVC
ncbi:hypothetical protein CC78DRAFT_524689 [Lojkania enalia]|uniref:CENP-V/GFA domain-containing protein n=1 Tax=Lojkania enalia TaxID=147567 RepID=A0A9P4K4T7_9PLEO|nr:hypothetical protein CC78DRAFT_524689 [Didymosphaeria enalia]